ncbi:hypothetical protein RI367_007869 [Sorochytrium milnesiophthora]
MRSLILLAMTLAVLLISSYALPPMEAPNRLLKRCDDGDDSACNVTLPVKHKRCDDGDDSACNVTLPVKHKRCDDGDDSACNVTLPVKHKRFLLRL